MTQTFQPARRISAASTKSCDSTSPDSEPLPGSGGSAAVLDEGLHAQDRVVAPVMRFAELPEVHAGREQRPVGARAELQHAGVEGLVAAGARRRLQDAGVGVRLHQADQRRQAVAGHQAVGVEHDHVAVGVAPAAAEVGHVAGLALGPALAPAVVHAHRRRAVGWLACSADTRSVQAACSAALMSGWLVSLRMKKSKPPIASVRGERLVGRAQAAEDGRHVLVADRHHDRGARGPIRRTHAASASARASASGRRGRSA